MPLTRRGFLHRVTLVSAAAWVGCAASGRPNPGPPAIVVERPDELVDSSWLIRLLGFPPKSRVEVTATMRGWGRAIWQSRAVFETDSSGEVDVAPQPSLEGTYWGASPMGLVWSMVRQPEHDRFREIRVTDATPFGISARTQDGSRAEITLDRRLASPSLQPCPRAVRDPLDGPRIAGEGGWGGAHGAG